MTRPKVFGIGFHKTGTTSLGHALERLGYRVAGPMGVRREDIGRRAEALAFEQLPHYDAFQDNPWPLLYEQLDAWAPGSRFVLTVRPTEKWIRSVCQHFGNTRTPMREWIYGVGSPLGNESTYVRRYEEHNAAVREYFADRPADLLVFRTGEGDGWTELCGFLGREVPAEPFPHGNSQAEREAKQAARPKRSPLHGWWPRPR